MSTFINTNTTASMAAFNLNNNSTMLSTDIQRLSTGLRINSAADDAAGLVVSENMDAQISGLTQATQNTNDATNMSKTAEGALSQVQNLLISMRQLAVQASNLGVNDSTDVQADQTQIASAIQSINEIASNTQFGTKYLLNGASTSATTTGASTAAYTGNSTDFSVLQTGNFSTTGATAATLAAGTLSSISATAATATTVNSSAVTAATGQGAYAATDYFEGTLEVNGTTYNIGGSGSNQTLAQVNSTISASGYTATVNSSTGQLSLTSTATGAPASALGTFSFSGLSTFANATTTTTKGSYASAGTNNSNVVITDGLAAVTAATATVTSGAATISGEATLTAGAAYSGTLVVNGQNVTLASAVGAAGIQTAVRALGTVGGTDYSAWTVSVANTGAITVSAGSALTEAAPTIDADGVTVADGAGKTALYSGSTATGTAGVTAASATADTIVGNHNGAWASTDTFGGSFTLNGHVVSLTGTANTLSELNTALQATTGLSTYTATKDSAGNLTFTDSATGVTTDSADLSTLQSYAVGSNIATGGYTQTLAGTDAQASFTDSTGSTVVNSTSSVTAGSQSTFYFSNGTALSINDMPLTGSKSVNGSITATAGAQSTGTSLEFQIGANEGQTVSLSIGSTAANQLGAGATSYTDANGVSQSVLTNNVSDVNVTTFKGAQDAIAVLDKAISDISTIRANLGAFESNVLQSNAQSLGVATTNLQAAQATITDTDMASTVVDYTKNQILVQAATSALAYANQMPQSILKLLQ